MRIEHVAIWTTQLEVLRAFYVQHFGCRSGDRYENKTKGFSSYFLSLETGARLELMQKSGLQSSPGGLELAGYAHMAVGVGSEEAVRELTERLRAAGVPILGAPRWTGDGCYESVVADPDGNRIEITV